MSLTQISQCLTDEDKVLSTTILKSQELFSSLINQFKNLAQVMSSNIQVNPLISKVIESSQEFVRHHEDSLIMVWSLTKRLFDLTEELATKEIHRDMKGFIQRENITPTKPKS